MSQPKKNSSDASVTFLHDLLNKTSGIPPHTGCSTLIQTQALTTMQVAMLMLRGACRMLRKVVAASLIVSASVVFLAQQAIAKGPTVQYTNAASFDKALSAALGANRNQVDVSIRPYERNHIPARLRPWLERLQESGGDVRWRDEAPPGRNLGAVVLGVVLQILAEKAVEALEDWLADPVEKFNAVIVVESGSEGQIYVKRVEFYRRSSSDWIDAVIHSSPTLERSAH